jgi:hypothetical protein
MSATTQTLKPFEATQIPHNPLDDIKLGDFYWVKDDDEGSTDVNLMCVEHIGSNFVKLSIYAGRGSLTQNVHFDDFMEVCEYEPKWTDRQLKCCLYWQPKARKALKNEIEAFLGQHPGLRVIMTPEAAGVHITATMDYLDIKLEWPPKHWTYQVVLAGMPSLC